MKEQLAKEQRIASGVKEILEFRGFKITTINENDEFLDVYAEKIGQDDEKKTALARFPKNPQVGVKTIRILGKLQVEEELDEALLIAEAPLTHYAKKESVKLGIEIISSSNPLFNIFEHELVPHHTKLTNKEIRLFLINYQIAKHQIPKILESDPAVKAIQAKPGDILRIVRNPILGEQGAYYRVVIKSTSRLRLTEVGAKKKKTAVKKTTTKKVTKKTETKPDEKKTADKKKADKTETKAKAKPDEKKTADKKKADKTETKAKAKPDEKKTAKKKKATKKATKNTETKAKTKPAEKKPSAKKK
ncbi:MAG: DNA-directed RNA polymerase subunit RpoH/Rpb5 C-terminal domain-containing protein [Candidatus Heimdallarchaeaceae archaeon]